MFCPYCNSKNIKKIGKTYSNSQRYKCNYCLKTFQQITALKLNILENKENFKLVLEELLTLKNTNFNYSLRTKRKYQKIIFSYINSYYSNLVLDDKVIVYDSYYKLVTSKNKHIKVVILSLKTKDKMIFRCINSSYLSKKSLRLLYSNFKEKTVFTHEKDGVYSSLIRDLNLIDDSYYFRLDELMINDIFLDNKKEITKLKSYLKKILNLTNINISNYVNLYSYFLQFKGSVKDKIENFVDSENFKVFAKKYLKTH